MTPSVRARLSGAPRSLSPLAADSLLLIAAVIWGTTFVAQKMAAQDMGPFLFTGLRFAVGALILLPLAVRGWRGMTDPAARRTALTGGMLAGLAMSAGGVLQQVGMHSASVSSAGFITGLYVIFVPLLGLFVGQRVRWPVWTGALLAVVGMFFLSVWDSLVVSETGGAFHLAPSGLHISTGDLWILACAVGWALHVQVVGWAAPKADPFVISVVQFTVTGMVGLSGAAILATAASDYEWGAREVFTWVKLSAAFWPLAYAAVLSTGLAFTLQVFAQRSAPPAHTAILLSLESVVAAIAEAACLAIGWAWLGAQMTPWKLLGCALMFAGVLVSQRRPRGEPSRSSA